MSLFIRRLRDSGKSWLWLFISFIPLIGGLWLLCLMLQPSVLV
ncbi:MULTISPECIES: DUF805 domain-containing protein [unclassified Synechococcus]